MRKPPKIQGIGGSLNSLDRETEILIHHKHSGRIHKIPTSLLWIIPTEKEFQILTKLKNEIDILKITVQQNPTDELKKLYFTKLNEYAMANNRLEPDILNMN